MTLIDIRAELAVDHLLAEDAEPFPYAWSDDRPGRFPLLSWPHLDLLTSSIGEAFPFLIVERTDSPRSAQALGFAARGMLYVEILDGERPFAAGRAFGTPRSSSVPTSDGYREPCMDNEIWPAEAAARIMRAWVESADIGELTLRRVWI